MPPRITQVQIRNYKSIERAVVKLGSFTAFVGPNGSGKSNFIDALAFVQQSLSESIELAFKNRGGVAAVRRGSRGARGRPTHIGIRLVLELPDEVCADYAFEIAAEPREEFRVARERCRIGRFMRQEHEYELENGVFLKSIPGIRPKVSHDRFALFAASATDEFRPVYDFLTSMRFFSIVPERLREWQEPDSGAYLKRDGSNAAAVLKRLKAGPGGKEKYERICRLLSRIVEGVEAVEYRSVGQKETLEFKQNVGRTQSWTFDALNMSDGTLRVLGLLLAMHAPSDGTVVAIEEPEATIHPAAAEVVVQVLLDAANERQVLVTTHSPDILDYEAVRDDQIRAVTLREGATLIAPVSQATRDAIRDRLYSPGELLRLDELNPGVEAAQASSQQLDLFGPPIPDGGQPV